MLFRQSLKPRADTVEVIDFAQDRFKNHQVHRSLAETPKVGELQMDWLRSEDLKEEKGGNHLTGYYSNCMEIAWSLSPCEENAG
jgi:hypothetical protein